MNAMRLSCKRNGEWGGKSQFARLTVGDEIWKISDGKRGGRKKRGEEVRGWRA